MSHDSKRRNRQNRKDREKAARAIGTHSELEWHLLEAIIGRCVRCGTQDFKLGKDHIVNLCHGGCDCIGNVQPMCAPCNASGPHEDMRADVVPDWSARLADLMERIYE